MSNSSLPISGLLCPLFVCLFVFSTSAMINSSYLVHEAGAVSGTGLACGVSRLLSAVRFETDWTKIIQHG